MQTFYVAIKTPSLNRRLFHRSTFPPIDFALLRRSRPFATASLSDVALAPLRPDLQLSTTEPLCDNPPNTTPQHHPPTATMSDSDSSGLSSAPEEEVKKLAPIFAKAKKATKKAAPPPKASPPRPKRAPSPPHEDTFADNPDIAVSRRPYKREMARW
jgi:hypothetical protein